MRAVRQIIRAARVLTEIEQAGQQRPSGGPRGKGAEQPAQAPAAAGKGKTSDGGNR